MKTFLELWYWRSICHICLVQRGEKKDKKAKIFSFFTYVSSFYILFTSLIIHPNNIIHCILFILAAVYSMFNLINFIVQSVLTKEYINILQKTSSPLEAKEKIVNYIDYLEKKQEKQRLERSIKKQKKVSGCAKPEHNNSNFVIKKNKI